MPRICSTIHLALAAGECQFISPLVINSPTEGGTHHGYRYEGTPEGKGSEERKAGPAAPPLRPPRSSPWVTASSSSRARQEEVRASGLVIPDTAREKPQLGEVIAVGPGRVDDNGKRVAIDVKTGDKVLYAKYSGQEVPRGVFGDEEDYMVLKETDILAKLA